jgi:two-component system nitrate/nitrite response regulator NarP
MNRPHKLTPVDIKIVKPLPRSARMEARVPVLRSRPEAKRSRNGSIAPAPSLKVSTGRLIRLVLACDHSITLIGLESLFRREPGFVPVACGPTRDDVVRAVAAHRPDILILTTELPSADGLGLLRDLKSASAPPRVILLADQSDDGAFLEAVRLGADGIVFRTMPPERLVQCVRDVFAGRRWLDRPQRTDSLGTRGGHPGASNGLSVLTRRQMEVVRVAASGLSNKELAVQLGISEGTIKNHLHAIYERLQLDGRLALLLYLKTKTPA